jgi:hypothetical protein
MRVGFRQTRLGPVQLLCVDRLQPRHELEAKKVAERKRYRALPMRIDVLAIHSISVQWRMTPSIIDATSDEEGDLSCEWMHRDLRSTCQTVIHIEFEATVRGHMLPDQRRAYDQNLTTQWHVRYDGPGIIIYLPKYLESDAQAVVAYSDDVNKRFRRCE